MLKAHQGGPGDWYAMSTVEISKDKGRELNPTGYKDTDFYFEGDGKHWNILKNE